MRIGIDIDGVLSDSNLPFINTVNQLYGTSFTIDDATDYRYTNIAKVIGKENIKNTWYKMYEMGVTVRNAVIPGSHLMNKLPPKREIITHRDIRFKDPTLEWLHNNEFTYDEIHFVDGNKSQMGKFDYFIEDCPDNVIDLCNNVTKIFLIDHIYNRNFELPNNVIRVKTWDEIYHSIIKEL